MAVAIIGKPSWPYRPAQGQDPRGRVLSDRSQPDQGPAQEIIGEMAGLLRDTRGSVLLGGSVLSAITIASGPSWSFSACEGGREGTRHLRICQWPVKGSLLEPMSAITRLPP